MKKNREITYGSPRTTIDYHRTLSLSVILCIALATLSAVKVPSAAAQATTTTYVLGVSNPTDPLVTDLQSLTSSVTILPGISALSTISPNSILFIDGNWLQSVTSLDPTVLSTILGSVLNGLPTVVVRGNAALLQDSISGLLKFQEPNLPLISDGIKIFSTLPDGTRQGGAYQVLAGFDYAISAEFAWAQQLLSQSGTPTLSPMLKTAKKPSTTLSPNDVTTSSGSWQFIISVTIDSGDAFSPVARLSGAFTVYKLQNSGSGNYDWWNFFANVTQQPGIAIYNSNWRNLNTQDLARNNTKTDLIVSHGPSNTTTTGPTTVTFSIGPNSGILSATTTASQTDSFFLKNANITDTSADSRVALLTSINTRTTSGKLTFQLMLGWTDRTTFGNQPKVSGSFTPTFATLIGSNLNQTDSIPVTFQANP